MTIKHLESNLSKSLPLSIPTLKELTEQMTEKCWPENLMEVITKVVASSTEELKATDFVFELTKEAAQKIFLLLLKHKFNINEALKSQRGTPLEYGSKFR